MFKVTKLFVTEACLHILITCTCTCFLCTPVKNGKILLFCRQELRYRVSDKLGPAARKQKINTFKLLKVMHKYLSAIHAGSSRERLRVQIPLVYTCLVLFASFYVKKPSTERQCLCCLQYQNNQCG